MGHSSIITAMGHFECFCKWFFRVWGCGHGHSNLALQMEPYHEMRVALGIIVFDGTELGNFKLPRMRSLGVCRFNTLSGNLNDELTTCIVLRPISPLLAGLKFNTIILPQKPVETFFEVLSHLLKIVNLNPGSQIPERSSGHVWT